MSTTTDIPPEIDRWTREGHQRFKSMTRFRTEYHDTPISLDEWIQWQMTRDPLKDDPATAAKITNQRVDEEQAAKRHPGIARRPRPARPSHG
jgi:hypothetical protein